MGWNILDVIAIGVFVVGIVLRFIPFSQTLDAARLILALDLILFYIRFLDVYSVSKELGPKLVMIGRMVNSICKCFTPYQTL